MGRQLSLAFITGVKNIDKSFREKDDKREPTATPDMFYKEDKKKLDEEDEVGIEVDDDEENAVVDDSDFEKNSNLRVKKDRQLPG